MNLSLCEVGKKPQTYHTEKDLVIISYLPITKFYGGKNDFSQALGHGAW